MMRVRRLWRLAVFVLAGACKDTTAPSVSTVAISPRVASLAVGDSVALTATVRDASGRAITGVAVSWSSSDTTVASVSTAGMVHARASGSVTIRAVAADQLDSLGITVSVQFVSVSETQDHTCALATNGAAYCWGNGYAGDLGNGTTANVTTPTLVAGGHSFRSIATMGGATCALAADSTAWCWGSGASGQIGTGDTLNRLTPAAVAGGLHFSELVPGTANICGLTAAGAGYCWGWNLYGQVGPDLANVLSPVPITGVPALVHVAAGLEQSCGLSASGAAYCWGGNFTLELGAVTDSAAYLPTPVAGGGTYRAVTGGVPACGLAADSTVRCWGDEVGALGLGYRTPTPLSGGPRFAQIGGSPEGSFVCGVTATGAAYCWGGLNLTAQDRTMPLSLVPVPQAQGHTFTQVGAGPSHVCGLATDSTAWCWGSNGLGQLGDSLAEDTTPTPVAVLGGHKFLSLQVGDELTCALGADSAAYCWGVSGSTGPARVGGGVTFRRVTAGGWESMCGLATDGTAYCWNNQGASSVATAVPGGLTFASLSAGDGHVCGVTAGGAAYCWGWNLMGDLGVPGPNRSYSATPAAVIGGVTFASVNAANWSTCGVGTDGTLYCWGWNLGSALGNGKQAFESRVPLPVLGSHAFAGLFAGPYHTCALTGAGAAWCWGSGESDTTAADIGGTAPSLTPIQVLGGLTYSSLTLGDDITCGLTASGAAYCWGHGQPNPTAVQDSVRFLSLSANAYGPICGVTTGHRIQCWTQGAIPAPRRQLRGPGPRPGARQPMLSRRSPFRG